MPTSGKLLSLFDEEAGVDGLSVGSGRRWSRVIGRPSGFVDVDFSNIRPCNNAGRILSVGEKLDQLRRAAAQRKVLETAFQVETDADPDRSSPDRLKPQSHSSPETAVRGPEPNRLDEPLGGAARLWSTAATVGKLRNMFEVAASDDHDSDRLSKDAVKKIMMRATERVPDDSEVSLVFHEMDINRDGIVDEVDFKEWVETSPRVGLIDSIEDRALVKAAVSRKGNWPTGIKSIGKLRIMFEVAASDDRESDRVSKDAVKKMMMRATERVPDDSEVSLVFHEMDINRDGIVDEVDFKEWVETSPRVGLIDSIEDRALVKAVVSRKGNWLTGKLDKDTTLDLPQSETSDLCVSADGGGTIGASAFDSSTGRRLLPHGGGGAEDGRAIGASAFDSSTGRRLLPHSLNFGDKMCKRNQNSPVSHFPQSAAGVIKSLIEVRVCYRFAFRMRTAAERAELDAIGLVPTQPSDTLPVSLSEPNSSTYILPLVSCDTLVALCHCCLCVCVC